MMAQNQTEMSLSQTLTKNIENAIQSYIETIAEKYDLNKEELVSLWSGSESKPKNTKPKTAVETIDMDDVSLERLHKCNKAELVALCKSKSLKCTGTKEQLMDRLLGKDPSSEKPKKEDKGKAKDEPEAKPKVTKKADRAGASADVIKKLTADIPVIPIRRNAHGNLEHPETGLVFDRKTETVIGKQEDDGKVSELTDEDIEACKRFKFKYNIPNNLDKKVNFNNVKVAGLDDDSDSEIEVIEESEEEIEMDDDDEVEEDEEIPDEDE